MCRAIITQQRTYACQSVALDTHVHAARLQAPDWIACSLATYAETEARGVRRTECRRLLPAALPVVSGG